MNVFEEYRVKDGGIWVPKDELERLREHWRKKTYNQSKLHMWEDLYITEGRIAIMENLIGLIEENE